MNYSDFKVNKIYNSTTGRLLVCEGIRENTERVRFFRLDGAGYIFSLPRNQFQNFVEVEKNEC
jgi:hypothetical protein